MKNNFQKNNNNYSGKIGREYIATQNDAIYQTIKDEFIKNEYYAIKNKSNVWQKCKTYMESLKQKNRLNGINDDQFIALKLMYDYTEIQKAFKKCFKRSRPIKQIQPELCYYNILY